MPALPLPIRRADPRRARRSLQPDPSYIVRTEIYVTRMLGDQFTFTGTKPRRHYAPEIRQDCLLRHCILRRHCGCGGCSNAYYAGSVRQTNGSYVLGTDPFDRPHEWVRNRFTQDIKSHDPSVPFYSDGLWNQALRSKPGVNVRCFRHTRRCPMIFAESMHRAQELRLI